MDPVIELGSESKDKVFKAVGGFFLTTKKGPPVSIKPGQLVRLKPSTAQQLGISGRLTTTDPDGEASYVVLTSGIPCMDDDGLFQTLTRGDIVTLTKDEAMPLLFRKKIRLVENNRSVKPSREK